MEMRQWMERHRDEFRVSRWVGGHKARATDVEKDG